MSQIKELNLKEILKNILQLLNKYSTGKNILILFVITQIIYFLMLIYTIPNLTNYAAGMKVLDLQPTGFSSDYAKALLENLGVEGRNYYLFRQIPLDMIYPFLFGVTYSLLLTYIFKKTGYSKNLLYNLCIIPLFAGIFDYLENFGIISMLLIYPTFSVFIANITNIFSLLKSISTTIFFVLLLIGIIGIIITRFRKQPRGS